MTDGTRLALREYWSMRASRKPVKRPSRDGRRGGQGRHDGEQHPDGGMEPCELVIAPEGQIDVHALEIGPAMPLAIEDAVEGLVYLAVLVGPQHGFLGRVHEGMGACGHEPSAEPFQDGIHLAHMGGENGGQSRQGRGRAVAFELDHMGHQLIGPDQLAHVGIGRAFLAGGRGQDLVGHGQNGQGLAVHDHVFDLDAEGGKSGLAWLICSGFRFPAFDPFEKGLHHAQIGSVLKHFVLEPAVDVGVVVDLNDVDLVATCLRSTPYRPSPMAPAALSAALITFLGTLPTARSRPGRKYPCRSCPCAKFASAGGHEVFASEKAGVCQGCRCASRIGRQIFLGDNKVGLGEQAPGLVEQGIGFPHQDHSLGKGAVGLLEHAGQGEFLQDMVDVTGVDDDRGAGPGSCGA
jgi:hypothetical protein